MKFVIYCVVLSVTLSYVYAAKVLDEGEACLVQYLKGKAKLSSSFPSTLQPSSRCRLAIPITLQTVREIIVDQVKEKTSGDSECLITEFDNQDTLDDVLKISLIQESKILSENEKKNQLATSRDELKQDLRKIAIQCHTDDTAFISVFNEYLGIKNETLEVFQFEYCISKYVADNSLLAMDNIDLNPHNIDTKNINCDNLIERERNKVANDMREKLASTPNPEQIFECVMVAFNNDKIFDYGLAMRVLYILDFPRETKESEKTRITQKIASFALSTFTCVLNG